MRTHVAAFLIAYTVAGATAAPAAQASQAPATGEATATIGKPLVLVGCVIADKANSDRVTLSDTKAGVTYRLRGLKVFSYSGRRVRIVGGLYPSPNIAAQAGSIDPTKAAMASLSATGSNVTGVGAVEPIEFHISQLRPLSGPCPPR